MTEKDEALSPEAQARRALKLLLNFAGGTARESRPDCAAQMLVFLLFHGRPATPAAISAGTAALRKGYTGGRKVRPDGSFNQRTATRKGMSNGEISVSGRMLVKFRLVRRTEEPPEHGGRPRVLYALAAPRDATLQRVWELQEEWLEQTKERREGNFHRLVDAVSSAPERLSEMDPEDGAPEGG